MRGRDLPAACKKEDRRAAPRPFRKGMSFLLRARSSPATNLPGASLKSGKRRVNFCKGISRRGLAPRRSSATPHPSGPCVCSAALPKAARHPILYDVERWRKYRTWLLLPATVFALTGIFSSLLRPSTSGGASGYALVSAVLYAVATSLWTRQRFTYLVCDG